VGGDSTLPKVFMTEAETPRAVATASPELENAFLGAAAAATDTADASLAGLSSSSSAAPPGPRPLAGLSSPNGLSSSNSAAPPGPGALAGLLSPNGLSSLDSAAPPGPMAVLSSYNSAAPPGPLAGLSSVNYAATTGPLTGLSSNIPAAAAAGGGEIVPPPSLPWNQRIGSNTSIPVGTAAAIGAVVPVRTEVVAATPGAVSKHPLLTSLPGGDLGGGVGTILLPLHSVLPAVPQGSLTRSRIGFLENSEGIRTPGLGLAYPRPDSVVDGGGIGRPLSRDGEDVDG
ncbi:unnamed protein product, partial [Laminaria digitata]